eukprot:scaffold1696_cov258-Pinguiococcus_pyrenoidosus.AAC.42
MALRSLPQAVRRPWTGAQLHPSGGFAASARFSRWPSRTPPCDLVERKARSWRGKGSGRTTLSACALRTAGETYAPSEPSWPPRPTSSPSKRKLLRSLWSRSLRGQNITSIQRYPRCSPVAGSEAIRYSCADVVGVPPVGSRLPRALRHPSRFDQSAR